MFLLNQREKKIDWAARGKNKNQAKKPKNGI